MLIPPIVKQAVVFVCEEQPSGWVPVGTGFVVFTTGAFDLRHEYLVTAAHVVEPKAQYAIRVNRVSGGTAYVRLPARWWRHPSKRTSDVVVMPLPSRGRQDFEISPIPTDIFAVGDPMRDGRVGEGDEVFATGLFSFKQGAAKNLPIVRTGNIALLTSEPIATRKGDVHAYLVESRSLGGLSGSPAFTRQTVRLAFANPNPAHPPLEITGVGSSFWLLGMMRGHWDLDPADKNLVVLQGPKGPDKVNLGIALVTPASEILDTINQPKLAAKRRAVELRHAAPEPTSSQRAPRARPRRARSRGDS